MERTPHTLIKASAGTGKTYRLSIRIVRLLALGEPAESITALTFTRAAAAEFLAKVVERLGEACSSEKRHREICADAGLDPAKHTREAFAGLLAGALVNSNRLTLGTLDSFFARLVNAFPLEVGIETGSTQVVPEHETESVIAEVATAFLAQKGKEQLETFSETLRQLAGGKARANPTENLLLTAKELHEAYITQDDPAAWGRPETIWGPADSQPEWLRDGDWAAVGRDADLLAERATSAFGKLPADLRDLAARVGEKKASAALGHLIKFAEKAADGATLEGVARGTSRLGFKHGTKTGLGTAQDAELVAGIFRALAGFVVRERLAQTRAAHACLRDYEEAYDSLARRRGKLSYSDYVRLLNEHFFRRGDDRRDLSAIHYRLDSRIRHWLLDEFQDTSTPQFQAIDPYLREIFSKDEGQSVFVVGDPKQSLYEWRKGNRRLLDTVERRLEQIRDQLPGQERAGRVVIEPLNETRRCSPPVLSLTNGILEQLESGEVGRDFPEAALAAWNSGYSRQRAFVDRDNPAKPGESMWVRFQRQPGNSRRNPSIAAQARWIAWHLRQNEGALDTRGRLKPGLTCAILVRVNSDAQAFVEALRNLPPELRVDANDESAVLPVVDNPVTNSLLAVLKVAAHPRDTMSKGWAEMSPPARAFVGRHGGWDGAIAHVADLFHREGAESTVHELCLAVTPEMLAEDNGFVRDRLALMRGLAESYDRTGERTLGGFIRHLEGTGTRGLADRGAVQVITIHRSKGLEYDMVYMPMPDDSQPMAGIDEDNLLSLHEAGAAGEVSLAPRWMCMGFPDSTGRVLDALDPNHLGAARQRAMGEQGYGALCALYVGITRARHRIVLMSDGLSADSGDKERRLQVNHLLHRRLGDAPQGMSIGPEGCPAQVMFADAENNPGWISWRLAEIESRRAKKDAESREGRAEDAPNVPAEVSHRRPLRENPSKGDHTYAQPTASEDLSKPIGGKSLGNRVHDLLAKLEWDIPAFLRWMDQQRAPKAMRDIHRTAAEYIRATLENAEVARTLGQTEESERLWIERKVASFQAAPSPGEKDRVTVGSFDRVHIIPGKSALIIDYKTARADKSEAAIRKSYEGQMAAYRACLHAMTGIPLESIKCSLIVVRAEPAVIKVF